jgi:capsular polysaccharide biosynthesis protein
VELTEAAQRILRHLRMITAVVVVALVATLAVTMARDDSFVASTRLSVGRDTTDPDEAKALVDTVHGIVTSPSQVAAALEKLGLSRNANNIANDRVEVRSVGISGVLILSVSDSDPDVAAALSNALAEQFLASRREPLIEPLQERLRQFDEELTAVEEEIDTIEAAAQQQGAPIDTLRLRLDEAARRRSDIRTQRQQLSQTLAVLPKPTVIDPATAPRNPEPVRLAANLVVAGLLALIIAVAIAAVLETLRPTIVSGDALARFLGAPVLGRVPNPPQLHTEVGDPWLLHHLVQAASAAAVGGVGLVSVGRVVDLRRLAAQLETAAAPQLGVTVLGSHGEDLGRQRRSAARSSARRVHRTSWAETSWSQVLSAENSRLGLVVVAPEVMKRSALSELEHLVAVTAWPLLGIIAYPTHRTSGRALASTNLDAGAQPDTSKLLATELGISVPFARDLAAQVKSSTQE